MSTTTMAKLPALAATALLLLGRPVLGFRPAATAGIPLAPALNADAVGDVDAGCDASFLTRRNLLGRALSTAAASSAIFHDPNPASAKVVAVPSSTVADPPSSTTPEREALLRALADGSSNDVVQTAIEGLVPLSPLQGNVDRAKYEAALDGEWKLLWFNTANFSPLLNLPPPLRPDSYQYFGSAAAVEVGEGRVAQGLVGGILSSLGPSTEVWLSSGAVSATGHPSTLEIYPPFRFQLGKTPGSSSAEKRTIVEADSDAEFRKANARTTEAQLAPKNEYEQLYLEDFGRGSLRVSVVASGDPVIVGEMFVHQKL